MVKHRNWSEDEVRMALTLYFLTSFGRMHSKNPDIVALADKIGRTANSVALKLVNLAALDNSIPQKGMGNVSKTDQLVWNKFSSDPHELIETFGQMYASPPQKEAISFRDFDNSIEQLSGLSETQSKYDNGAATEKRVITTQRIGQEFFRRSILISYEGRCALTGIEDSRLLNASHIVPWKDDILNRVNPTNGICLNALHDRAFDRHLITFDEEYRLIVSPHVPSTSREELLRVESSKLSLPKRFLPDQSFLEVHRRKFHQLSG
jgi:hypothetical protein